MRAAVHALRQCAAEAPAHIRQVFWCCSTGSSKKYKSISFFYKHCFATSLYFWFCVSAKSCQNLRLKNWISKNNYFLLWTSEALFLQHRVQSSSSSQKSESCYVWILLDVDIWVLVHQYQDFNDWIISSGHQFDSSHQQWSLRRWLVTKNVEFYKMTVLWEMTLSFQELIKLRQVTKITTWKSTKPVLSVLDAIFQGFRWVGVTEVQVPFIW